MVKRWLPLEANPDVMANFVAKLGLDTSVVTFHDVLGFDEELLMMVPQPVLAVLLLFPITEASEAAKKEEETRLASEGQAPDPSVYFMKQTIGNACGTIGLLHAILNNIDNLPVEELQKSFSLEQRLQQEPSVVPQPVELFLSVLSTHVKFGGDPGSFIPEFHKATESMNAADRGKYLEEPPEGAPDIEEAHQEAASAGDTSAPDVDEDVDLHFVCFVEKNGCLFELDGRKPCAINHGPATSTTLLKDSIGAVRAFVERTNSIRFNMIALAPTQ